MRLLLWQLAVNVIDPLGLWRFVLVQPARIVAGLVRRRRRRSQQQPQSATSSSSSAVRRASTTTTMRGTASTAATAAVARRDERPAAAANGDAAESHAIELAYRVTLVTMGAAALIWTAVFMYLTFYYTYMPAVEHVHAVHMQYDSCNHDHHQHSIVADSPNNYGCEFPHAFVRLDGAGQQRLRLGQTYKVFLYIDMPDSPTNRALGVFMVCASMRDEHGALLDHSCRPALMRYRSWLVRTLRTWVLSPLYVLQLGGGEWAAEQQRIEVEVFEAYGMGQRAAVRDVYVELQARQVEFYAVQLRVVAHFSGLRYAMWHWPLVSAVVGIATNLLFILVALALSYYNWGHVLWFEKTVRQRLWLPGGRSGEVRRSGSRSSSRSRPQLLEQEYDGSEEEEEKDESVAATAGEEEEDEEDEPEETTAKSNVEELGALLNLDMNHQQGRRQSPAKRRLDLTVDADAAQLDGKQPERKEANLRRRSTKKVAVK